MSRSVFSPAPVQPPRLPSRERGLTLVEVIFAIAILSFMVSVNYKILTGVIKSRQLIDDRRESMYIANSVLNRLSREIQLAVKRPLLPPPGAANSAGGPGTGPQPFLLGQSGMDGTSLTFQAKDAGQHIPDGGVHSGIVQIKYSVKEDTEQKWTTNGNLLLVREELPNIKAPSGAPSKPLVFPITYNLKALSFRFFDSRTNEWTPEWAGPNATRLPKIIEFTITLRSPAGKETSLTSAVHIGSAN